MSEDNFIKKIQNYQNSSNYYDGLISKPPMLDYKKNHQQHDIQQNHDNRRKMKRGGPKKNW